MASELLVNKITPESGTTLTLGESGDTITLVTSTIDVTVADGRLGIGIVPSGARLEVSNGDSGVTPSGDVFFEDDASFTIVIATPNDEIGNINFSDPDAGGQGKIRYNHSNDSMQFDTNGSEAMRIDSSGHAIIPNGVTLGTAAGTYNAANTIDDYEEGTWTPVVSDASSGGNNPASVTTSGAYTKIGRMVRATFILQNIDTTGMTSGNVLYVQALPFTTNSSSPEQLSENTIRCDNISFTGYVIVSTGNNNSFFVFRQIKSALADSTLLVSDVVGTTSDLVGSVTYFTD